jgi:NitT/TauT family transport system substrate-binding protein
MSDTTQNISRRTLIGGGGALVAASAFPCPALAQGLTEVHVGIINAASDIGVFLGDKRGWYKEEGISIKTTVFRSAADMVAPLSAGQLDVGGGSASAGLYNAFGRGVKLRIVADKASSQPGFGVNKCLVAKKHVTSGRFKTMKDLKGMKVAMNGPGNSNWGSLWGYLKSAGLNLDDVETTDLTYPNHVLALQNGSVDASITTEPSATIALLGGEAHLVQTDDVTRPNHAIAQILYSEKIATAGDLPKRFMRAYLRTIRYVHGALKDGHYAGPKADEIIEVLVERTPIKDPKVFRTITPNGVDPNGRIDVKTLVEDFDVYKTKGWITAANVTPQQAIDMSFVEAAVKELGPYKPG